MIENKRHFKNIIKFNSARNQREPSVKEIMTSLKNGDASTAQIAPHALTKE